MTIESDKPLKKCRFCNKDVRNLGNHIANIHPSVLNQLEELEDVITPPPITASPQVASMPMIQQKAIKNINEIVSEKLETMLNLKIIEMLSKGGSIEQVQNALQPTANNPSFQQLKEYHELIYGQNKPEININTGEETGGWIELANNALPIISQLLQRKTGGTQENDTEHRGNEEESGATLKPIQFETEQYRSESENISTESRDTGETKQPNDTGITRIN